MKIKLFSILTFFSLKIFAQCTGSFTSFADPPSIVPGESTSIKYSLTNNGSPCISAINIDITFDPDVLTNPNVVCGSASQIAGKVCQGNLVSDGNYRIIIYGGINVIGNGYVAYVSFQSYPNADYGNTNISCAGSASDPDGNPVSITSCQQTTINIKPPNLSCSASANPQAGSVPLTVYFTSSASGGVEPYNFNWQFGDGGSSTLQNPQHTYTEPGIYAWDLTIKDSLNQSCQRSGQIYAGILECIANANPEEGYAPLTVQFTSSGEGGKPPYNYNWDFGDGENSTLQNPQHTYKNKGKYNWRLTVSDSSNQECIKEGEINVEEKPQYIYFIPASAESIGAEGTNWKTDLALYNEGEDIAEIKLYFLERGKDNRNSEEKVINLNSKNGFAIIDCIDEGERFFAYGSVVDNTTGDAIFVPAK